MRILRTLLPGLGVLLLGYLIGKLGVDVILEKMALVKWSFPLVLGLAFSWHVTNSIAWYFAFLPDAFRPRLRTLFMAKLAGESVNQLTPLANLGGSRSRPTCSRTSRRYPGDSPPSSSTRRLRS